MKEEIRPVIVDGIEVPGYFVSNYGKVFTAWKKSRIGGKFVGSRISEQKQEMRPRTECSGRSGQISGLRVELCFEPGTFGDYAFRTLDKKQTRKVYVHQLVMQSFRPIIHYPPEKLKSCWDSTPEEVKKWISETVVINHIDHDPTNNHVNNLEYVTPRENTRAAVKLYGNLANRKNYNSSEVIENEKTVSILEFV